MKVIVHGDGMGLENSKVHGRLRLLLPAPPHNTYSGPFTVTTRIAYQNKMEDSEGGHTVFPPLGVDVSPVAGSLLLWSNCDGSGRLDYRTLHGGLELGKGRLKHILNIFFDPEQIDLGWCKTLNSGLELNATGLTYEL